jgi:hypothetical protein
MEPTFGERPGREIALDLVGRFWTPSDGQLRVEPVSSAETRACSASAWRAAGASAATG